MGREAVCSYKLQTDYLAPIYTFSWLLCFPRKETTYAEVCKSSLVSNQAIPTSENSIAKRSFSSSHQATYMVDVDFPVPTVFDPFADSEPGAKEYVHIRVQQRNGKKCLTTVQGLPADFSYDKILKALKKELCCNGNVVQDKELGKVIQLQGDQRKNVQNFLVNGNLVRKNLIKIHGF